MLVRRKLYNQTAGVLICHNNFSDSIYQYDVNMKLLKGWGYLYVKHETEQQIVW